MELINISLNKNTLTCPSCCQLARFYIHPLKRQIKSKCIDGHEHKNISYNSFVKSCIKEIWSSNKKCKICETKINEFKDNFICKTCGHIFCAVCIETHCKNSNHNDKIKYINYNSICQIHNEEYILFCKSCNSNLCDKCKKDHKGHCVKSYKYLLTFIKTEIDNFKDTIKENKKIIRYAEKKINRWTLDGLHRLKYLYLLHDINEYYLKNFNFEFFNFYHFQNLKYFYEFVTNQIDSINSVQISYEYIPFRHFQNNIEFFQIKKYQKKKYLFYNGDDDFILYDKNLLFIFSFILDFCYLKLFEIKNYSLRFIDSKSFGEKITLFRPMKKHYGYIFVFCNIVRIFQYDENNKKITLKDQFNNDLEIDDILDLKNGDIIIATSNVLRIVKEKKTIKFFGGEYRNLYHINDLMFISGKINEIIFFDSIKYQIIKKIKISPNIKIRNFLINDKFIIVITESNEYTYIIDIKYLEIIHIIENHEIFNFRKDFHYTLYNNDIYIISDKQIEKYTKYNNFCNYGKSDEDENAKYNINFSYISRVKVDKNHIFLIGNKNISEFDLLL